MKSKILAALLLVMPAGAMADTLDVIEFKLNEGCTFETYMGIVTDFNGWAKSYGYRAEIMRPLHRPNLETMYWIGRTKDAETFGNAWDTWRNAQTDAASMPARLAARFVKCSTNLNRSQYDTYK